MLGPGYLYDSKQHFQLDPAAVQWNFQQVYNILLDLLYCLFARFMHNAFVIIIINLNMGIMRINCMQDKVQPYL